MPKPSGPRRCAADIQRLAPGCQCRKQERRSALAQIRSDHPGETRDANSQAEAGRTECHLRSRKELSRTQVRATAEGMFCADSPLVALIFLVLSTRPRVAEVCVFGLGVHGARERKLAGAFVVSARSADDAAGGAQRERAKPSWRVREPRAASDPYHRCQTRQTARPSRRRRNPKPARRSNSGCKAG